MAWLFVGMAAAVGLLGLAALVIHPVRLLRAGPLVLLRGCAATMLLVVALGFLGLAALIAR